MEIITKLVYSDIQPSLMLLLLIISIISIISSISISITAINLIVTSLILSL